MEAPRGYFRPWAADDSGEDHSSCSRAVGVVVGGGLVHSISGEKRPRWCNHAASVISHTGIVSMLVDAMGDVDLCNKEVNNMEAKQIVKALMDTKTAEFASPHTTNGRVGG